MGSKIILNAEVQTKVLNLFRAGFGTKNICKQLNLTEKPVQRIADENGIDTSRKRKHEVEENYFSVIDSEIKVYLLGIIYGSASVCGTRNFIAANLNSRDSETLKLLSEQLYHKDMTKIVYSDIYKGGSAVKFAVYSKQLKEDLLKLGCSTRKTESKFPDLPLDLKVHFIRAIFERLMCFSIDYDKNMCVITITENSFNLNYLSEFMNIFGIKHYLKDKILNIYGKYNCLDFIDILYKDANYKLLRKYEKYQKIKSFNKLTYTEARIILLDIDVVYYYNQGWSCTMIARKLNETKETILRSFKRVGVNGNKRHFRKNDFVTEKTCLECGETKGIENFKQERHHSNGRLFYRGYCLICMVEHDKKLYHEQYKRNKHWHQNYRIKNRDKLNAKNKEYRNKNESILREKYFKRKDKRKITFNEYCKLKRQNDPQFKLRGIISNSINHHLKQSGSSKNKNSCLQFLPYTMKELREHLQNQFEPWMTWKNHGVYRAENWNENDPLTWKWQLDHIIPHSLFKYTSMDCDEFRKCWSLENLRPYNAKQNYIDGTTRVRHNIENSCA